MSLLSFCGKFAVWISVAIVLVFIALIALAVFCVGLGAVSSVTNPHATQDTGQQVPTITGKYQPRTGRDLRCGQEHYRWIDPQKP